MSRRFGAILIALTLATCALAAQAPEQVPTPGQILLLVNSPGTSTAAALKRALTSDDPRVRLAAGRVMAVEPDVASVEALVGALAREQDPETGAELVTDLLLDGGATAVPVVDPQTHRLGPEALLRFAEWQARMQPEQLGSGLSALAAVPGQDDERLAKIVVLAARQHPERQRQLLDEWMAVAPPNDWAIALNVLDLRQAGLGGEQVLVEALRSGRRSVRLETVWYVLEQLQNIKPSREVLDLATGPAPADSSVWEVFGRELIARHEHKKTADRTDLIHNEGADHLNLIDIALRSGELTSVEQKTASSVLPFTPSPFAEAPSWLQASAKTIVPVVSGIVADVFRAAECDASTGKFGVVAATYGAGRPSRLQVNSGGLSASCVAALAALARTALADDRDVTSPALKQLLVLPISREFASCTSTPGLSDRVPSSDSDRAELRSVQKIKDVKPVYPPSAIAQGIAGVVILDAQMSTTGCVYAVRLLRSIPELDLPALAAVLQWQFDPARLNGRPIPLSRTVTVNFLLR